MRGLLCCISATNIEKSNDYPSEPHTFQFVAFCDTFDFPISFSCCSYHTTPTPMLSKSCSHRIRQCRRDRRGSQLPFILIKPPSPTSLIEYTSEDPHDVGPLLRFKGDHHMYRYISF